MSEILNFRINGMHCNSCSRLVEVTLKDMSGVESIDVDFESGEARLQYDPDRLGKTEIAAAVRKAGYEPLI